MDVAHLASFPGSAPNPVLEADLQGRVTYANPAARRDLPGVEAEGCAHPFLAGWRDALEALRRDPAAVQSDVVTVGERSYHRELIFLPERGVVRAYGHDDTAQIAAERALREANERLSAVDRQKDEFLAVLSHELRNPLSPIKNGLYILERAAPGSEQARRALRIIARQTDQLTRLVDDLLDVTRIKTGKVELLRAPLDLGELAQRAAEDHQELLEKGGVALEVTTPPHPVAVHGDPGRLAQIVGNLLHNAAKFVGPGGRVRVDVGAEGDAATLRVQDDGIGMAPETLEHVFERFAQGGRLRDRTTGGLGLGLALVKGLVELHGGSVEACSAGPGRGSTFTIRLPRLAELPPAAPRVPGEAHQARARVLVIEDDRDSAELLTDVLDLFGHEVAVARRGTEGLRKARELHPDAVICDIGLPGMSGYEIARALRAERPRGDLLLVALSGYAQPDDLRLSEEAGFDRHLAKPPRVEELRELLSAWLLDVSATG